MYVGICVYVHVYVCVHVYECMFRWHPAGPPSKGNGNIKVKDKGYV